MARSFGRVLAVIWDDEDFKACSPTAQRMYVFLLSQPDLEHSGVIPLRERRWASSCKALTAMQVRADVAELCGARFTVADEETEELLVRSLIRRDEIWRQPNVFKAALASARAVKSAAIRGTLAGELQRLDLDGSLAEARDVTVEALEAFANPSGTPGEPFGSAPAGASEGLARGQAADPPSPGKTAGENPSGTLSEPQAKVARAKGEISGNGEQPFPLPLSPSAKTTKRATATTERQAAADALAADFWDAHKQSTGQSFITIRNVIRTAVNNGVDRSDLAKALDILGHDQISVSGGSITNALRKVRGTRGGTADDLSGETYGKGSTDL